LPQGSIDSLTRFVLTNAIYFDAAWQDPFAKESTHDGTFNLLDGSTVTVPMMNREGGYSYIKDTGYQAIELPYDGNEIAMDIIMPDTGKFTTFESAMTAEKINGIIGSIQNSFMALTLPKFSFDSSFSLKSALSALVCPSLLVKRMPIFRHYRQYGFTYQRCRSQSFCCVDEEGTEAAAATGVVIGLAAMPQYSMTVDQPFIFLIRISRPTQYYLSDGC